MLFKQVKPANAFCNGKRVVVENLNVQSISDNLVDEVTFKYTLADSNQAYAGEGTFTLKPDSYKTWDASADGAYIIVAKAIGLELIGE